MQLDSVTPLDYCRRYFPNPPNKPTQQTHTGTFHPTRQLRPPVPFLPSNLCRLFRAEHDCLQNLHDLLCQRACVGSGKCSFSLRRKNATLRRNWSIPSTPSSMLTQPSKPALRRIVKIAS